MMFWFRQFMDAVNEAHRRADLTGRRYRVWYDPANRWWNGSEQTAYIAGRPDRLEG